MIGLQETDSGTKDMVKYSLTKGQREMIDKWYDSLTEIWDKILEEAIMECPIDTGTLVSTIRIVDNAGPPFGGQKAITIYDTSIVAGDPFVINPKTGRPCDYACFTENNFVVSNPKVYSIPELQEGIKVYSFEDFEEVEGIRKRDWNGDILKIYRYKSNIPLEITDSHHVFAIRVKPCPYHKGYIYYCRPSCKYHRRKPWGIYKSCSLYKEYKIEMIEAKDLKVGDYLISPRLNKVKDMPSIDNKLCRLIGYFLAEGNIYSKYYVRFSFNNLETEFINDVKNLMLEKFGKRAYETSKNGINGGCFTLTFCSSKAVEFFKRFYLPDKKFGESGMKYLPQEFLYLPIEKQREIICGLFRGDGLKGKNKKRLGIVSRLLAEQTRIILERFGFSPAFRVQHRYPWKDVYLVEITGNEMDEFYKIIEDGVLPMLGNIERKYCLITDEYIAYPIRKIVKEHKMTTVWDVQVANTHSLVVNGCLVSNSWVHDGHVMPDGRWWFGVPFLTNAFDKYESELIKATEDAIEALY